MQKYGCKNWKVKSLLFILIIMLSIIPSAYLTHANDHISVSFDPDLPESSPPSPPSSSPSLPSIKPPVANISGPKEGYVNETLFFSAHYSYDPDGYITAYRWDFTNDGLFDTPWTKDVITTTCYTTPGNYTIKLQVNDNDNLISTAFFTLRILELKPPLQPPVAHIEGPYTGVVAHIEGPYTGILNENITFNSTGSYDPDGEIIFYTWDFGDHNTSTLKNPIHKYAQIGNYIVMLTVTDNDNLSTTTISTIYIRESDDHKPPATSEYSFFIPTIALFISALLLFILTSIFLVSFKRRDKHPTSQKEHHTDTPTSTKTKIPLEKTLLPITPTDASPAPPHQIKAQIQKKPIPSNPIGESLFLKETEDKLGDIFEAIYNEEKQIIGYKIREKQSNKPLNIFAEHVILQGDVFTYVPSNYTMANKIIEHFEFLDRIEPEILLILKSPVASEEEIYRDIVSQNKEIIKNIENAHTLQEMLTNCIHILKKQQTIIEDKILLIQKKKEAEMITEQQYTQETNHYIQILRNLNEYTKNSQMLQRRLEQTTPGILNDRNQNNKAI
ncbi:MAG: PKD domain-containing protein [Euryarchaeota archaeon]|nr:PKD domain-containing protein [Euryarchaeota archaeon]